VEAGEHDRSKPNPYPSWSLAHQAPRARGAQVLELLTQHEVHRVYVVAPGGPPHAQAAITPTDVMRLLAGVW
jgi:hypothetical protein